MNFVLQLKQLVVLTIMAIFTYDPLPPQKKVKNIYKKKIIIFVFSHCVLMSATRKITTDFVNFISFKLHHLTIIEVLKIK